MKRLRQLRIEGHTLSIAVPLLILTVLVAPPTSAHRVNIFAYAEGDTVHTESYFSDGTRCDGARITVYDKSGELLLEGTTDAEGLFEFPLPKREDLRIVVDAGMGHQDAYLLTENEIRGEKEADGMAGSPAMVDEDNAVQIRSTVEAALEKKLAPLVARLDRMQRAQEQASFRDIIGGIGYIVGLMGLAAYFRSRKGETDGS